jgi:alpha-beta hydrolase superfamily lysophospholipase
MAGKSNTSTILGSGVPVLSWPEPDGITPRGTLIVIPGRGERPELYERFGHRVSFDGYRVHAVRDPTEDAAVAASQISAQLAGPGPLVLVGSDTGALFAVGLVVSGQVAGVSALVLAGLPVAADALPPAGWDAELESRTACPAHRARLAGTALRRGALGDRVPEGWASLADLSAVTQPVLGIHGAEDRVSPLGAARLPYAAAPHAELVSITGGKHDALNDVTHRTVAATVVEFLERLRLGAGLPAIATRVALRAATSRAAPR